MTNRETDQAPQEIPVRSGWGLLPVLTVLVALSLLFFLFGAGGMSIWSKDIQGMRAEIVREMVETGDYLIPHLNGVPYLTKPPLYYWLASLSAEASGAVWEFPMRLPSILGAFLGVLMTLLIGERFFNRRTGFLAAVVLISSPLYFFYSRSINLDMTLAWLVAASVYFLVDPGPDKAPDGILMAPGFLFLGLAVMTKGPLALLVVLPPALYSWWRNRGLRRLSLPGLTVGLALFFLLTIPWGVAAIMKVPSVKETILEETLFRYQAGRYAASGKPFHFYIPVLLGMFAPWSLFFPAGIAAAVRAVRDRLPQRPALLCLLAWTVPALAVFSATSNKRDWYLLPLAPAVALLVGWVWDRHLSGAGSLLERRLFKGALWLLLPLLILGAGLLPFALLRLSPDSLPAGLLGGAALAAAAALGLAALRRGRSLPAFWSVVTALGLLWILTLILVWPTLDAYRTRKAFFREAGPMTAGASLYSYRYPGYDLQFYSSRSAPIIQTEEALQDVIDRERPYIIAEDKHRKLIEERGGQAVLSWSWQDPARPGRVRRMHLFRP